ncbi:MAG: DUF2339 domain-containing protein [Candidatus Falkowbacteria bacterium]
MNTEKSNESKNQFDVVIEALHRIEGRLDSQEKRLVQLEQHRPVVASTDYKSAVPPPPPSPDDKNFVFTPAKSVPGDDALIKLYQEQSKTKEVTPKEDGGFEEKLGGKWFARTGLVVLFLGVFFLLKYAFDNDWIGEVGRIILGLLGGFALLIWGERTIRKYPVYGQLVSGGGLAILYLTLFAAYDFYHLINQAVAFLAMIAVTAAGIALSLRYKALPLMGAALLGGFVTPMLIASGDDIQIALFSYLIILDAAVLFTAFYQRWHSLNLWSMTGTAILFLNWSDRFYTEELLVSTMFYLTAFFLIYSVSAVAYNLAKKEISTGIEQVSSLLTGVIFFGASYSMLDRQYHDFMGFFAILMACYYFGWAYYIRKITPKDTNLYSFLAFLTIGFITISIPIQLKYNVITIAWAIEAIILYLLSIKLSSREIRVLGSFVFGLTLVRVFFVDLTYNETDQPQIWNQFFVAAFAVVVTAYFSAYFFFKSLPAVMAQNDSAANLNIKALKNSIAVLVVVANFLTVFAVSHEIGDYYSNQVNQLDQNRSAYYNSFDSYSSGYAPVANQEISQQITKLQNRSSVSLSIFWLLYGIGLMILGFSRSLKKVRLGGLVLLLLAILKLFFYDLWGLGGLYRVCATISLGVVLLAVSFAYQKYKDKIKEMII